jgi:hypothetical protein
MVLARDYQTCHRPRTVYETVDYDIVSQSGQYRSACLADSQYSDYFAVLSSLCIWD